MFTLQVLHIGSNNLQAKSPDSLAEAMVGLREVDLSDTDLTEEHCQVLMDAIRNAEEKTLEKLNISENNLQAVSPDVLAEAVVGPVGNLSDRRTVRGSDGCHR